MDVRQFLIQKSFKLTGGRPINTPLSGIGSILCFHRVIDSELSKMNSILEISSRKFETTLKYLLKNEYVFLSLDELYQVMLGQMKLKSKFIVLTFDDGYIDNYSIAYPILKKYNIPFAIYLTTNFPDKKQIIWWYALEELLMKNEKVEFVYEGKKYEYVNSHIEKKYQTFNEIRSFIINTELSETANKINAIFENYIPDLLGYSQSYVANWEQIIDMSRDPIVTFGAHTITHPPLSKLTESEVIAEVQGSREIIESKIQSKVRHFAYPFGSKNEVCKRDIQLVSDLGFRTAVTTMNGNVFLEHKDCLTALPRVFMSDPINQFALNMRLNGVYQYISNNFRKMDHYT